MSDCNQEFTDQRLDPANEHSDECADGAVGLVDRTQQLLDEVDQLLGVPPKSEKDVRDDAEEADEADMGNSVETLKKFLSDLGESSSEIEDCENSDDAEEVPNEASDSADAEALESDEPNPPESEEANSLIEEPQEVADEAEAESEAEEAELEPEPKDDAEEVVETETDTAADTQIETDDQPNEPESVEGLNEDESDNESSEEDLGFDLEAIKRAFEDEFRYSEEDSAEEEENRPEPISEEIENSPAVEETKEPFSTESWLAENLDTILDDEETSDSTADTVEPAPQPTKADLADDGQLVGSIENRLLMIESSMDSMFEHLENRIEGMFANLSEQVKCLSLSATSADRVGHETIEELGEETVVTDYSENEFGSDDGDVENDANEDQTVNSHEERSHEDDNEDSEKVKALKDQLTSKLREAEIELSINRAKLSQQKATIEQMQADLDRREAALDDKLEQAKRMGLDKKKGLLNRWKRHMGDEE